MKHNYLYFLLLFLLSGCYFGERTQTPENVEGYQPIYASKAQMSTIYTLAARPLEKPGKIYTYGRYLFIGEQGKGIHVIDNIDNTQPQNISFIEIPANNDIAIKGNVLYADNAGDLISLDISNPLDIRLLNRVKDVLPKSNYQMPPEEGYFECPDNSKGVVVGWQRANLQRPKCRY